MRPNEDRRTQSGRNERGNMVSIVNGRESVGTRGDLRGFGSAVGRHGLVAMGWDFWQRREYSQVDNNVSVIHSYLTSIPLTNGPALLIVSS